MEKKGGGVRLLGSAYVNSVRISSRLVRSTSRRAGPSQMYMLRSYRDGAAVWVRVLGWQCSGRRGWAAC